MKKGYKIRQFFNTFFKKEILLSAYLEKYYREKYQGSYAR